MIKLIQAQAFSKNVPYEYTYIVYHVHRIILWQHSSTLRPANYHASPISWVIRVRGVTCLAANPYLVCRNYTLTPTLWLNTHPLSWILLQLRHRPQSMESSHFYVVNMGILRQNINIMRPGQTTDDFQRTFWNFGKKKCFYSNSTKVWL